MRREISHTNKNNITTKTYFFMQQNEKVKYVYCFKISDKKYMNHVTYFSAETHRGTRYCIGKWKLKNIKNEKL